MTVDQAIQLILSIGFPSFCLFVVAKWAAGRIDRSEQAAIKREDNLVKEIKNVRTASEIKEAALLGEIKEVREHQNELERWVRNELVSLVRENKDAMNRILDYVEKDKNGDTSDNQNAGA